MSFKETTKPEPKDILDRSLRFSEKIFSNDSFLPYDNIDILNRKRKYYENIFKKEEIEIQTKDRYKKDIYAAGKDAIKLLGYDESKAKTEEDTYNSMALTLSSSTSSSIPAVSTTPSSTTTPATVSTQSLVSYAAMEDLKLKKYNEAYDKVPVPEWHAPWKLGSVVSGHLGWVRSIAFDPSNEWFATGSADRTIKIWDLAKCCAGSEGGLRLTLTGHINAIRGLAVSTRHPYLFSGGEDKMVKCWDLETNKVVRSYHGHLSGVFSMALHPTLDLLVTGGRDSVARVWDIRTRNQIHVLTGHENTVSSIITNAVDPQIITGSYDSTIRMWDLVAGKTMSTLTHHKKGVRSLIGSKTDLTFTSGSADNIKKWKVRDGTFIQNFSGHNTPVNALALNEEGVLVSCGDDGTMRFWDYNTGYCFQKTRTIPQSGSLEAEAGIYAASFDHSGTRLVTCEADKSIKIWQEDTEATEDSHPINAKDWAKEYLSLSRY